VAIQANGKVTRLNLRLIEIQVGRTSLTPSSMAALSSLARTACLPSGRFHVARREAVRPFASWRSCYCEPFGFSSRIPLARSDQPIRAVLPKGYEASSNLSSARHGDWRNLRLSNFLRELSAIPLIRGREEQDIINLRIILPTLSEYQTLTRARLRQQSFPLSLAINRSPARKSNGERAKATAIHAIRRGGVNVQQLSTSS
jgi:hypothetical protein